MASSPWNTQAARARDLRTFFDFLWSARDGCGWREATPEDRAAYEWWRRRDERGPRVEDTSWDREVSTVNQFYLWAFDQDLVRANPVRQRTAAAWLPWTSGGGRGGSRHVPAETSHTGPRRDVKWPPPASYRVWRNVGLCGFDAAERCGGRSGAGHRPTPHPGPVRGSHPPAHPRKRRPPPARRHRAPAYRPRHACPSLTSPCTRKPDSPQTRSSLR
ncbi:site-specific integrase [Streptomyces sp. NPDC056231]|uniref:site-specific integrase n=1 Tax=Streptomyces sp. NPDC056231 TaxID=3345755 RepID=UPI003AAEDD1D